ncbi:MAG: hypothetical protein KYX60_10525 [Halomonas meridiana]|jgi:hypothetical protein|uniref:hypothetical protein n=1 Tax=Vreelandella aquamarina TaxID=77097 RepID=UPI000E932E01|nr:MULTISPECIES: hypothetical protein [Halomonas]MCC4290648.1 hypothetical protein [Halomonas axialensis]MDK2751083.1 hypothetical protein [Halomonas meridiana]HBN58948.1 hypothetical protein [Halomonas sp.]|tara:strand:+ start:1755 stop:2183 length:429 start_codon:yes stop_codon:yes gene_type:complete
MTASFTRKRLYRVGSCPLERAVDDVKQLAEAVWYRGYQPKQAELELLRGVMPREDFQRALCVLELLSQYPVCRRDTARHLQQLTGYFHQQLLGNDDTPTQGRYSPSKRWGLSDTTAPLRKALLPLQTRTYADATGHRHGLSA